MQKHSTYLNLHGIDAMHVFTLCHVGSTYPLFGAAVTSFLYVSYSPAGNKQKGEILRCLFNEKSGVRKPRHQRLVFRILPIALCIQNASAPGITIGSVGTKHSDYTFRVRVLSPPRRTQLARSTQDAAFVAARSIIRRFLAHSCRLRT